MKICLTATSKYKTHCKGKYINPFSSMLETNKKIERFSKETEVLGKKIEDNKKIKMQTIE